MVLPEFRQHGFDRKFENLPSSALHTAALSVQRMVGFLQKWLDRPIEGLVVLDLGCGRGELVAELRRLGARAFGIEIDPRFVESGRLLESHYRDDYPILSIVSEGKSVFPDGFFDLVVSDQVLEHVADIDVVAAEVARLLKHGGMTCHQFPARFRFVEPHYKMPMVHWLPKNAVRRAAISRLLSLGFSKRYFPSHSLGERTAIIYKYSVDETFYRPAREIAAVFRKYGVEKEPGRTVSYAKFRSGGLSKIPFFPSLIAAMRMMTFTAKKVGRP